MTCRLGVPVRSGDREVQAIKRVTAIGVVTNDIGLRVSLTCIGRRLTSC